MAKIEIPWNKLSKQIHSIERTLKTQAQTFAKWHPESAHEVKNKLCSFERLFKETNDGLFVSEISSLKQHHSNNFISRDILDIIDFEQNLNISGKREDI